MSEKIVQLSRFFEYLINILEINDQHPYELLKLIRVLIIHCDRHSEKCPLFF